MAFSSVLAGRLSLREDEAPRWTRGTVVVALLVAVAAGAGLLAGLRSAWLLAPLWLALAALGVAGLAARLRPVFVVAAGGLAVGVAALFVVLGVASGVEQLLVGSLARLNGHAMVSKYGLDFFEYEEVAETLEADPRVRAASPFVFGVGAMVEVHEPAAVPGRLDADAPAEGESGAGEGVGGEGGGEEGEGEPVVVTIKGVDPERLAGFSSVDELFAAGDLSALRPAQPRSRPGIVLGTRLARRLDVELGSVVRVVVPASIGGDTEALAGPPRHGEFEVLGLLDTGFAEFDSSFALMHISAAQAVVYGEFRASGVELELADGSAGLGDALPVARELVAELNAPRTQARLQPLYRAASWAERSATLISIRQTKALIAVVLTLIVVVASGALIGALLLLVRRKRRDIGVLATMGARRRQVFWAFELVGVWIGVLGSALGLAFGALSLGLLALLRFDLDPSVYMIDHLPVAFVLTDMLIPSALAILICALVAGPVAWRASGLRPMVAIRG